MPKCQITLNSRSLNKNKQKHHWAPIISHLAFLNNTSKNPPLSVPALTVTKLLLIVRHKERQAVKRFVERWLRSSWREAPGRQNCQAAPNCSYYSVFNCCVMRISGQVSNKRDKWPAFYAKTQKEPKRMEYLSSCRQLEWIQRLLK